MKTKTKRLLALLVVAVILITAISSVKDKFIDLSDRIGRPALADYNELYDVNIHFLDTGTSDCIILNCGGEYVLVDCGRYTGYEQVNKYIRQLDIDRFAAVINSHPDADHIGAIPYLLEDYEVDMLYCSEIVEYGDIELAEHMLIKADENSVPVKYLSEGCSFEIGGLHFDVLAPYEQDKYTNPMSLVIKVHKNDFSLLLTGDSTKEVLAGSAQRGNELSADILKVPHHGSSTSTDPYVLDLITPKYAVITVGDNSFGLPDPEVLELFEENQIPLLLTDNLGNIIISSNCDGNYTVNSVQPGGQYEKTNH